MEIKCSRSIAAGLILLVAVLPAACGTRGEEQAVQGELVVAAASNLTNAFDDLAKRFNAKTGVRVVHSFGATADLAKQIENGAPFDVFAAADARHVEELRNKDLLTEGSAALYARGRLVLWLPRGRGDAVVSIKDLAGAQIERVAIANPGVAPYGVAAIEALRALNVWSKVEPKIVYAQTVAQAKQFAATGNADAAFIPRALLETEGRAISVDASLHSPIDQSMGIVRASKRQQLAQRYLDFVLGEEGQAVLESYGYERPR